MNSQVIAVKNNNYDLPPPQPPFGIKQVWIDNVSVQTASLANTHMVVLDFDASRNVPTAAENRPLNLGMTPGIYLGV
jgi:hypothetical protein